MRIDDLSIDRLAKTGEGVATFEGRSIFVPSTLPGDRIKVRFDDRQAVLRGEVTEILEASAARKTPPCAFVDRCGGCDWMHIRDDKQLQFKEEIVRSTLEHVGGIGRSDYEFRESIGASESLGYRRRATLHPSQGKFGFNVRRTHEIAAIDLCVALVSGLAPLPGQLAVALQSMSKDIAEVQLLEATGAVAISVSLRSAMKPKHEAHANALIHEGLVDGVVLTPASGAPAKCFGKVELDEAGVFLRPDAFAQANAEINRKLVDAAMILLEVDSTHSVLELYSGNGNFTLPLARHAREVISVESASVSVKLAHKALMHSKIENVRLIEGDVDRTCRGLMIDGRRFSHLLLDPPRTGAPGCERWAESLGVDKILYVACDPASLARDAKALAHVGFRSKALQLVDLFPQTHHIEAVMSFERSRYERG